MNYGDILIHIDETLDDDGIHSLERDLGLERGILSACVNDKARHLMLVDFDPVELRPSYIVEAVRGRGLHAEMIGF
jgi:hypothetical protein